MSRDPRLALRDAIRLLAAAGVDDPAGDARRLMEHAGGVAPGMLSTAMPDRITPDALEAFDALIARRAGREPVSHLTGVRSFRGRDFIVTPDTLDPRPDTETLVEIALAQPFDRVLDLGTGTGCILLTLLAEQPGATGLGTDISEPALDVARANAARLGLEGRVIFQQADWFEWPLSGEFDLIVSNPPYIAADEMADLAPEVRDHEPHIALTDGADGLTAYSAIAAAAVWRLSPGGRIIVEIGPTQGNAVADLFRLAGFDSIVIHPDIDGRDRVVTAMRPATRPESAEI